MNEGNIRARSLELLSLSRTIRGYEKALSQAQGEHFNLFEILDIGHYEVRTHSPILAELLNPQGSHGQGAVFLRFFLELLEICNFDAEGATVRPEVDVGALGRIDLVISDPVGRQIKIENKIYAGLQKDQLERYDQFDPKAPLVLLTLNEDAPAVRTDPTKVPNLKRLSYRSHILQWLERCRKEVATVPAVREAITQYIHLIKRLTHQNTSSRMNNELLIEVLKSRESYLAYAHLRNAGQAVRHQIIQDLNAKLGKEVKAPMKLREALKGNGQNWEHYLLTTPTLAALNLAFGLEFERSEYRGCYFGFCWIDHGKATLSAAALQELFKKEFGVVAQFTPAWPALARWNPYDWNDETFAKIQFESFHKNIIKLFDQMHVVAERFTGQASMEGTSVAA